MLSLYTGCCTAWAPRGCTVGWLVAVTASSLPPNVVVRDNGFVGHHARSSTTITTASLPPPLLPSSSFFSTSSPALPGPPPPPPNSLPSSPSPPSFHPKTYPHCTRLLMFINPPAMLSARCLVINATRAGGRGSSEKRCGVRCRCRRDWGLGVGIMSSDAHESNWSIGVLVLRATGKRFWKTPELPQALSPCHCVQHMHVLWFCSEPVGLPTTSATAPAPAPAPPTPNKLQLACPTIPGFTTLSTTSGKPTQALRSRAW